MDNSADDHSRNLSRRALLGGIGVGTGVALAGCFDRSSKSDTSTGDQERIEELEAQLAEAREENAALRRRLDAANLWGFDEATMDRLQEIADTWAGSVVAIDAITGDGVWRIGTGWVYDEGIVATNAHVLKPRTLQDEVTQYHVWDHDGRRVDGKLLGYTYGEDDVFDGREDIGFLRVSESITDGRRLDRGTSRDLSPDEPLLQIGHPYSLDFWTAAVGPFIGHREPFFASNVPGQPGVSGSPVIDLDGDVVGMTWGGQYVRRPQRRAGEPPEPGDGQILPAFETAMNGKHSYLHRIDTAAEEFV